MGLESNGVGAGAEVAQGVRAAVGREGGALAGIEHAVVVSVGEDAPAAEAEFGRAAAAVAVGVVKAPSGAAAKFLPVADPPEVNRTT